MQGWNLLFFMSLYKVCMFHAFVSLSVLVTMVDVCLCLLAYCPAANVQPESS